MKKYVIGGDLHIRARTWAGMLLTGDTYWPLEEIAEYSKKFGAPVILSGDLFDHGLSGDTPMNLSKVLSTLNGVGHVVYAIGNHDRTGTLNLGVAKNPEWAWAVFDRQAQYHDAVTGAIVKVGDRWYHREYVIHNVDGVRFAVLHYCGNATIFEQKLTTLLELKESFDVLVMHQAMKELLSFDGAYEVEASSLVQKVKRRGCRAIVCGHVHTATHWDEDGVLIVSPGATYPEVLSRTQPQYAFPVLCIDKDSIDVEWHPFTRQRRVVFHDAVDGEDSYQGMIKALENLVEWKKATPAVPTPVLSGKFIPVGGFYDAMVSLAGDAVYLDIVPTRSAPRKDLTPVTTTAADVGMVGQEKLRELVLSYAASELGQEALTRIYQGEMPAQVIDEIVERIQTAAV